jgi:hypothetical protein
MINENFVESELCTVAYAGALLEEGELELPDPDKDEKESLCTES